MSFDQVVTFLAVSDVDRSSILYGDVLGLEMVLDQVDCRVFRVCRDGFLGVCQRPDAPKPAATIVTLVTDDVDGWHDRLVAAGVTCDRPPQRNERYDLYHAFYRDPDGHVIEIQTFLDPSWPRS